MKKIHSKKEIGGEEKEEIGKDQTVPITIDENIFTSSHLVVKYQKM